MSAGVRVVGAAAEAGLPTVADASAAAAAGVGVSAAAGEPAAAAETLAGVRASARHTTDARTARDVVFYRLGKKFVDNERSIPEDVRSVMYYTLAIGHHTGVIDCLEPRIGTSRAVFADVLAALPEGAARDKLAGVERFGEIQLNSENAPELREAVHAALNSLGSAPLRGDGEFARTPTRPYVYATDALSWLVEFAVLLDEVEFEPQVYAMGRRVTA